MSSIPLNIHEVWPRSKWGGGYNQKKTPVDHFIGHIPLLYKNVINRYTTLDAGIVRALKADKGFRWAGSNNFK